MENLKLFYGTYKGLIGEYMFRLTRKFIILTKLTDKDRIINYFNEKLKEEQKIFLETYWHSIDALEFKRNEQEIILYEVKTKNAYKNKIFKPKMTLHTHNIYNKAQELGFVVKLILIRLHNNWNFEVEELEFNKEHYQIDSPKRFDKVVS
ncbi:MAG: hypothetical protein KKF52_03475 [Nanoarchaeota archaeon]|nr:hypothetical protein [Nanoarchaeota archaeon]MBU4242267.1 hypothetical protein [Nanoarchaeota archaeon]